MAAVTDFVALAVIRQPHGVRGEVKLSSTTEPPEAFLDYPLTDASGVAYRLIRTGTQKGLFICRIEGVRDRNAAEILKGRALGVPRSILPALASNQIYSDALIGLHVQDEEGRMVGTVRALVNYGASDILIIDTEQGELMLPYAEQFFPGEPENGILTCRLPEIVAGEEQA